MLDGPEGQRGRLRSALESRLQERGVEGVLEAFFSEGDPRVLLLRPALLPHRLAELVAADSDATEGLRRLWTSFRAFRWPEGLLEEPAEMLRYQRKLDEDSVEETQLSSSSSRASSSSMSPLPTRAARRDRGGSTPGFPLQSPRDFWCLVFQARVR